MRGGVEFLGDKLTKLRKEHNFGACSCWKYSATSHSDIQRNQQPEVGAISCLPPYSYLDELHLGEFTSSI
jgi:hypothetical protein